MGHRRRLFTLLAILSAVSLTVGGISIGVLHGVAFEDGRSRLSEMAKRQARLIEAVADYNWKELRNVHPGSSYEEALRIILSQVIDARASYVGFGETGEFLLGRREGDDIVFFWSHHHQAGELEPVAWDSEVGLPMRRALLGESGTVTAYDHHGKQVLAAYEPLREFNWGIVVKMDRAEIRAPFVRSGLIATAAGIVVIALGALLFFRVGSPLVDELQMSESQTRAIVETAMEAIITIDHAGAIQYFNPAAERLFGYTNEEVTGSDASILIPASPQDDSAGSILQYLEPQETHGIGRGQEIEAIRKDGSIFPIYLAVSEVRLGDKRFFTGIIHDLSEHKEAEAEKDRLLRQLNRRNRELNCIYSCAGLVRYKDWNEDMFLEIAETLYEAIEQSNVTGVRVTFDGRSYTSGQFRETPWELSTDIVAHDRKRGAVAAYLDKAAEDFEDRVALEEEHGLVRAVAWMMIESLVRREAEAKVIHASTLASIGELAAGVGHEINNPINGIINCADILIPKTEEGSKSREFAEMIRGEAERIAVIVRDLLTFSRQERQEHSTARLCDIVESVLTLCRKKLERSQVSLQVDVPTSLPELRCRSERLQQVLMNLIINSLHALDERFPGHDEEKRLSITAHERTLGGEAHIRLTVEDRGCGISPANIDRIFDPFFTTKGRDKGTGLGLSVSDGIIKSHKGVITVESEEHKFTRVIVDLPLPKTEALEPVAATGTVKSEKVGGVSDV